MEMARPHFFTLLVLCGIAALTACRTGDSSRALPTPPAVGQKLDGALRNLVEAYEQGGEAAARKYLQQAHVALRNRKVPVDITVVSESDLAPLRERIGAAGGEPTTQLRNHQYALLPVPAIKPVAELESVWSMALVSRVFPVVQPGGDAAGNIRPPEGETSK